MKKLKKVIDWLKGLFSNKESPGYLMQLFSIWASLFFAAYAIFLTIRMDKVDKKTEILTDIVLKLDTTNQNLIITQKQNEEIIAELLKQNFIQNSQLISINKQWDLNKDKAVNENFKDWLKYEKLRSNFREFVYINLIFPKDEFLKSPRSEKKLILKRLSEIIENMKLNPVVYRYSEYLTDWNMFKDFWFETFNFSMTHYTINDRIQIQYEGKLITSGEEYLYKVFDRFQLNFQKVENKMTNYELSWRNKYLNLE